VLVVIIIDQNMSYYNHNKYEEDLKSEDKPTAAESAQKLGYLIRFRPSNTEQVIFRSKENNCYESNYEEIKNKNTKSKVSHLNNNSIDLEFKPPLVQNILNTQPDSKQAKHQNSSISELWKNLNEKSKPNVENINQNQNPKENFISFYNYEDRQNLNLPEKVNRNTKLSSTETITSKSNSLNDFILPNLPEGKTLVFRILSTWGDPNYVGLMGIEIFDSKGCIIKLKNVESQLWADPADINILNEYKDDPRTIDKLVGI
jgi:hypothetical protein